MEQRWNSEIVEHRGNKKETIEPSLQLLEMASRNINLKMDKVADEGRYRMRNTGDMDNGMRSAGDMDNGMRNTGDMDRSSNGGKHLHHPINPRLKKRVITIKLIYVYTYLPCVTRTPIITFRLITFRRFV